ncbi:Protein VirD4 [Halioglobus japonicus]|nr:Protein VirD4 [Halioglobus japonicus]
MQSKPQPASPSSQSVMGLLMVTGLAVWATLQLGPVLVGGDIQPLPAFTAGLAVLGALRLVVALLNQLARLLDWRASHTATGKEGTARWGTLKDLRDELASKDEGPFWGTLVDKPNRGLFIPFSSNAYVIGPSGVGKGHTAVVPMILTIMESKIITDFKPELLMICKKALEAMGQVVVPLNPFGKYEDRVGPTECLNPLDVITDDLFRPGGLRDIFGDARDMAMQLHGEPVKGEGENKFFRSGTRKLITMASLINCMFDGYDATLGDVSRLLEDRDAFENELRAIVGVDMKGNPHPNGPLVLESADWAIDQPPNDVRAFVKTLRGRAKGLLALMCKGDGRTYDSFAEGAEQSLAQFGFGRLSSSLGRSTFDFDEIKSGKRAVNVFLVGDASRTEATEDYFGLMQWYMQLKLKRHPNKDVPVYQINDEASNYSVYGLVALKTWGRGFGIRTIEFFQNFAAYGEKHGDHAVDVLNSEAEIKLILPGQRSASTIKQIAEVLGNDSVMTASLSAGQDDSGLHEHMSESARPLATEDEIRRSAHGTLIVRQHYPFQQVPVSYSEINPLRDLADINPHHGVPFLKKVKLKLKGWRTFV